jgi:hypothetical protein
MQEYSRSLEEFQHQIAEERIPILSPKKQRRLDLLLDRVNEGKLTSQQSQETSSMKRHNFSLSVKLVCLPILLVKIESHSW